MDATRVFLSTSNGSALHFYTATDGDTAFTAVPLPDAPIWGPPIFAPGTPSKIAVQLSITDISGLAFDAAGTLFLVRDWTLYSKSTFE